MRKTTIFKRLSFLTCFVFFFFASVSFALANGANATTENIGVAGADVTITLDNNAKTLVINGKDNALIDRSKFDAFLEKSGLKDPGERGFKEADKDKNRSYRFEIANPIALPSDSSETQNANPDVSRWNTSSVTDMTMMFRGASAANPDVSQWNTSKVVSMSSMFADTTVANPQVSNWKLPALRRATGVFVNSKGSKGLDLTPFNFAQISAQDRLELFNLVSAEHPTAMYGSQAKAKDSVVKQLGVTNMGLYKVVDHEAWARNHATGKVFVRVVSEVNDSSLDDNTIYEFASPNLSRGWVFDGANWYYLDDSAPMRTSWVFVNNKWYYLDASGAMLTGRHWIDGRAYTFNGSGAWIA